mgnify:CR=1 FL=1
MLDIPEEDAHFAPKNTSARGIEIKKQLSRDGVDMYKSKALENQEIAVSMSDMSFNELKVPKSRDSPSARVDDTRT